VIREALENARTSGICLVRGPCFTWRGASGEGIPVAVNWAGAVLWTSRCSKGGSDAPDYSTARLLTLVNGDLAWFYRFSLGFDQGRALSVVDPKTGHELHKDADGLDGLRLAKEFAPWRV
jgi:hypothetical protein